MKYEEEPFGFLNAQLTIGKSVIESMLELAPKKGTEKATIPVTLGDNEFEIEVRMKLFGYEVEKEKLYTAKLKSTCEYLRFNRENGAIHHFKATDNDANQLEPYHFTKDELIQYHAWGNDAYDVKEVEE